MDRDSFFCPITHEVMIDPVVDPEGNTYERAAIESWLSRHPTSPLSRTPLHPSQLVPNRALREVIQEELRKANDEGNDWHKQKKSITTAPPPLPLPPTSHHPNSNEHPQSQLAGDQSQQAPSPSPSVPPPEPTPPDVVELKVTASKVKEDEILVHASIVPSHGSRLPADICCVVDISGSMGTEASIKTGTGEEKHGLSLLDIVKHAVKTVVHSLRDNDRFALVVFHTTARTVFELTAVTEPNRQRICSKIDSLEPEDTTNLWDGLHKGLEVLKKSEPGRVSALLLLTDGLPNVSPPRGELAMLKKYKDEHKQLNTTINTFGFGYSIDTPLLLNLAVEGHGMHAFIPDASFVGTAFVNSISNLLVSMALNVTLSLEGKNGGTIQQVLGYPSQPTSWGSQVQLCSLQYGQAKDLVFRMAIPPTLPLDTPFVSVTLHYESTRYGGKQERVAECSSTEGGGVELEVNHLRLAFSNTIAFILELVHNNKDNEARAALADIQEIVRKCGDPRARALLQDISGQVKEAIQRSPENYFAKWGRHYLPSLARAHLLQQCNNFKDPGIQVYGGEIFQQLRDTLDDTFLKLPPPKPSARRSSSSSSSSGGSGHRSAPRSMGVYHNAAGPCFAGECLVRMAGGGSKRVDDIVKGDEIMTRIGGGGEKAEVVCVVKTYCYNGKEDLVVFPNGLRITPYHPMREPSSSQWHFPMDLAPMQRNVECEAVFNFVLSTQHTMVIEEVECVTLGHGILGDSVVSHPYFGSELVVEDLRKMRGWESGMVELFSSSCNEGKCMVRDKETGLVCGFAEGADRRRESSRREV